MLQVMNALYQYHVVNIHKDIIDVFMSNCNSSFETPSVIQCMYIVRSCCSFSTCMKKLSGNFIDKKMFLHLAEGKLGNVSKRKCNRFREYMTWHT